MFAKIHLILAGQVPSLFDGLYKFNPRVLRSAVPVRGKAEGFFHLPGGISSPLMVVFSALLLPASLARHKQEWFHSILTDLPGILSSRSIAALCMALQRSPHPQSWKKSMVRLPLRTALGIRLTLSNTKAVLEALLELNRILCACRNTI